MTSLSVTIRLRPVRIALLTRPKDSASIRKFIRACSCLWGGVYNPIIPVFGATPQQWKERHGRTASPREVTRGYIEFFEPDAYVEAQPGLAEEAGLAAFRREHSLNPRLITLGQIMKQRSDRDWAEPALGLSIVDALQQIYDEEQRFELRQPRSALLVDSHRGTLLSEAIFGVFPTGKTTNYFRQSFENVYKSERLGADPASWREVFLKGATTPLRLTRYKLEPQRAWHDDLVIFVFDPANSLDVIDLWNMRSEPNPVLPVPIDWWSDLVGDVRSILKAEHRPLQGNAHGVMHRGTIEFARSISEVRANLVAAEIGPDMPDGSVTLKTWRSPVWKKYADEDLVKPAEGVPPHRRSTDFRDTDTAAPDCRGARVCTSIFPNRCTAGERPRARSGSSSSAC